MVKLIDTAYAGVISDAPSAGALLADILAFLLQISGILGIIAIVVSGGMLWLSAGDAERAKKAKTAMMHSVVGMAVVLGSLMILRMIAGAL